MEWKRIRLGDYISIKSGLAYSGSKIGKGDSVLLGMGCVSYKDKFVETGARPYDDVCDDRFVVKPGDIVLATRQQSDNLPILAMPAVIPQCYQGKRVIFGTNLYKVENNSVISNKFLFWLFKHQHYVNYIAGVKSGTAVQMVTKKNVEDYKFLCPPANVRDSISNILWTYDNLIENNNKRIRLLEQMAENLYKEWFVRFRFPGHEKAEFENGLPKGWKRIKISDVCNVTDGVHNTVIDAPQSKYLLLSSKNIKAGKIVIGDNERTIGEDTFINLRKRTKMSKGDILLSSVGTIGEVCLLNEEPSYYEFQRSVAIIKPDYRIANSCLLYEMFKVMRNDFVNAAHGAAQQCLFIGDLKKMKICLPSKTISDLFGEKVQQIYNLISSISEQNANLSRQRDLLLPRLMSGKLEVNI